MRFLPLLSLALVSLLLNVGCPPADGGGEPTNSPTPPLPWAVNALELATADSAMVPRMARLDDGGLLLSWVDHLDGGERLQTARLHEGDEAWGTPQTAIERNDWMTHWSDGPGVLADGNGGFVAHWSGDYAGGGYGAQVARSADGSTWGPTVVLHDDSSDTEHGYMEFLQGAQGSVVAGWLDGREFDGGSRETQLILREFDSSNSLGPEVPVDLRTCDCCPMSTANTGPNEGLFVYRDRSASEIRDIYAVRWDNGVAGQPVRVNEDGWEINGCPTNGPSVDAKDGLVVVGWFTNPGNSSVRAALSTDGGLSFGDAIELDGDLPIGRLSVAVIDEESAAIAWVARVDNVISLRVRRLYTDGTLSEPLIVTEVMGGFATPNPRMMLLGNRLVFAWQGPNHNLRSGWTPIPR